MFLYYIPQWAKSKFMNQDKIPVIVAFTFDSKEKPIAYIVADKLGQQHTAPVGRVAFCVSETEHGEEECLITPSKTDACTTCMQIYMTPKQVPDWIMQGQKDGTIKALDKFTYDPIKKELLKN